MNTPKPTRMRRSPPTERPALPRLAPLGHVAELWLAHPVFAALGPRGREELGVRYPATTVEPGGQICEAGHQADVCVLLQGTVRLFHRTADGREANILLLPAPSMFGDCEVLRGLSMLHHAEAVDKVTLSRVGADDYLEVLTRHPAVALAHLRSLAGVASAISVQPLSSLASLEQRIAALLVTYGQRYGVRWGEGLLIDHPLSRGDMARALGATKRAIRLVLGRWQTEGLLDTLPAGSESPVPRAAAVPRQPAGQGRTRPPRIVISAPERLVQLAGPLMRAPHAEPRTQARSELEIVRGPRSLIGRRYPIEDELVIGRNPGSSPHILCLSDPLLASRHCRVCRAPRNRYWVHDLQGRRGTRVNGKTVLRQVLRDGDRLEVGQTTLLFHR